VVTVESRGTHGRRWATGRGAARPVVLKKRPVKGQRLYFVWGLINSPLVGLGWCLTPLGLSVHTLGVLGETLTHLCLQECESIASECDSSALHREDSIEWHYVFELQGGGAYYS
jgi:hypothetical protein